MLYLINLLEISHELMWTPGSNYLPSLFLIPTPPSRHVAVRSTLIPEDLGYSLLILCPESHSLGLLLYHFSQQNISKTHRSRRRQTLMTCPCLALSLCISLLGYIPYHLNLSYI